MSDNSEVTDSSDAWVRVARSSHDRFAELLSSLDEEQLTGPSYDDDWSIADVASHLGSQAEIFGLFFDSAVDGSEPPGREAFGSIWDRWNALPPESQVTESVRRNTALVERVEALSEVQRRSFHVNLFGQDADLTRFLIMRTGEFTLHTWDIAVALDPNATLFADATELLIDQAPDYATRGSKPQAAPGLVPIRTTAPARDFVLTTSPAVSLISGGADGQDDDVLTLPAESLLRLLAGRLDDEHTPDAASDDRLDALRIVFPGY